MNFIRIQACTHFEHLAHDIDILDAIAAVQNVYAHDLLTAYV